MDNKNKENRRVRLTKQMIQDSLIALLGNKPIEKISISELCKLADVNRTTFYNHYGSQYDVLRDVGENIANRIVDSAARELEDTVLTLGAQVSLICCYLREHTAEAKLLLQNFTADDALIKEMLLKRLSAGQNYHLAFAEKYDDDGKRLLLQFLVHGIYNLIRCWLLEEIDKTPEDIGAMAGDIALNGWIKKK